MWPPGEFRLPCPRGHQPEHAGAQLAHIRRRPAADLHTNAKRLVSPLHELLSLQKPAQHSVRAVPRVLGWCDDLWSFKPPPFFLIHFIYVQCRITWTRGFNAWPLPGISALLWSAPDWRHSGLEKEKKSPEGSTSQVLLLINIANRSKGIRIHYVWGFLSFFLIEIIYFICVQSFLWSVRFFVWLSGDKWFLL